MNYSSKGIAVGMSSTICVGVKLKLCTLNSVIRTVGGLYNLCWSGSLMLFFNNITYSKKKMLCNSKFNWPSNKQLKHFVSV